ncbi:helix-turn-helix domain-containing protein [Legionella maceachernii]|uniref:Peptidase, S24 family n=1 Tax=Legionella maceachernii TaxID=466 RepID=A0A0W0VV51_9GAMM|nr:helix-turn-helix domain-containing protein [Legionella maceachernii]KTD23944.1 peptidase, S24 family [Legionella maceachernii]SKA18783.1 Peptidase S24-like [Legionella maceachernii]SUP04485.1 Uncharacterized HTH-type transcriptional regulator CBU_1416 [Legionella maceachernii]
MLENTDQKPVEKSALENLSENLANLLKANHINEAELARKLNITYNTIHRIINRTTPDPKLSTLKLIAEYFHVSLDYLLSDNVNCENFDSGKPQFIPILSWEYIQTSDFNSHFVPQASTGWIPVVANKQNIISDKCYALESTRSMSPRFPIGSTFVVKPDEPPIDGDLVIIRFKEDRSVSLRELVIDSPDWQLLPIIPGSKALIYDKEVIEIIGIVILTLIQSRHK